MQKTILRLVWPYLQRYLAKQTADYLAQRRQQKRQLKEDEARLAELAQDLSPAVSAEPGAGPPSKLLTADAVWYILAGVLVGSALTVILTNVLREET
ncbi:MAG: hypothetical protein KJ077_26435 [Anaerolineae bacterium]|nr:hypothetical protein [Anaerolineae bacterium]